MIKKSGFRMRRTPQNDPMGFDFIHSPSVFSVSFDSLAPARLTPPGPTFGCSSSKVPTFPVVVNSAGFGVNAKFAGNRCQAQRERPQRFLHGIMWTTGNRSPAAMKHWGV